LSRFPFPTLLPFVCVLAWTMVAAQGADDEGDAELAAARQATMRAYERDVAPFIKTYCGGCHSGGDQEGGVTFQSALGSPASPDYHELWKKASAQLKAHNMPPEGEEQPGEEARQAVVDWIAAKKILSPKDPGEFVIRRLNRTEYGNTLHDLFGVDPQIAADLPDEVFGAGYTNSLSPLLMEQYLSVANDVLKQICAPPGEPPTAVQQRLFGEDPGNDAARKVAARNVAQSLARQAYRRPPSESEVDLLLRVFALAGDQGKTYDESLRLMLKAVLVSPQFLFITPAPDDAGTDSDIVPLDDHQLAARLSYLLWATMPDAELSELADAGRLHDPEVLAAQARRLIADPRSRALFDGFGAQWLGVDKLAAKPFDETLFPQMTTALRTSMYDEARLLFESVLREDRSLATFIDSDYTFLNDDLAAIYGLPTGDARGPALRKVALSDPNRGGILTMPGVLATSSFPNRTSPVNRGVWVLEQVLGEHIPPPPADVPALEEQRRDDASLTLRQLTELHRTDPVCANCHKVLDPIGFGLENFDAIGRWRDQDDSGGAIDASGELPGDRRFGTPQELKQIIAAQTDDFCHNLTSKLLAYALCRQLGGYDEVVADQIARAVANDGYRLQTLVVHVVTSYPFTHRRLADSRDQSHAK
jgi:mono/diheme cytochrome c family protein